MRKALSRVAPARLLRFQVVAVVASAAVAVLLLFFVLSSVRSGLQESSSKTSVALLSFRVHDELLHSLTILQSRADHVINSRPQEEQFTLRQALLGSNLSIPPADVQVALTLKEAAVLQATYDALLDDARHLAEDSGDAGIQRLVEEIQSMQVPLNQYLNNPSGSNFHELYLAVSVVENQARSAIPSLIGAANAEDESLRSTVRDVGFISLGLLLVLALLLIGLTVSLSERVSKLYADAETERRELVDTTSELRHRNEQMNALYTVFTEITDTLSLRYVVNAALREAIKLMRCEVAVLRLMKDGRLEVAGTLTSESGQVENLEPRSLGEETVGRVAKRGKSIRVGEHNQDLLSERQREDGMRSGMVIPLIIGAKVVGTLSVWSSQRNRSTEEDERILGMMGSQIATAVVAADTTEASEHRAHHDPLTGLPNRLQLSEDIAGEFRMMQMEGRPCVVAMVDIDHFKRFNDDFGHAVGDVSLQKVASTLRMAVREQDRVYRYGGEEFVIIFVDTTPDAAQSVAERVRSAVEGTLLTGDELEPVGPVTISMGLAAMPEDGRDFGSLMEMADLAMYRAKSMGRNQIATWRHDILTANPSAA